MTRLALRTMLRVARREVIAVPAELLTKNGRTASKPIPASAVVPDDPLRALARKRVERVRRVKFHAAAYVAGMVVLTPIWALTQWQDNGAFKHFDFSPDGGAGDWEPWILYVALVWGLIVAIHALKVYFDRPTTDAEIEREIERRRPQP